MFKHSKIFALAAAFSELTGTANALKSKKKLAKAKESSSCAQSPSGHRIDTLPYWAGDGDLPCMYSGN